MLICWAIDAEAIKTKVTHNAVAHWISLCRFTLRNFVREVLISELLSNSQRTPIARRTLAVLIFLGPPSSYRNVARFIALLDQLSQERAEQREHAEQGDHSRHHTADWRQ